jgi:hypothetical protein
LRRRRLGVFISEASSLARQGDFIGAVAQATAPELKIKHIWLKSKPEETRKMGGKKERKYKQQGFKDPGIDCCFRLCAAGGASVSPPAHGAYEKHKTTYPSFKRGGIGGGTPAYDDPPQRRVRWGGMTP